jgi:hypothetical protein
VSKREEFEAALKAFLDEAERDMLPKMERSAMALAIFDGRINAQLCIQIGAAVVYDKPIILLALDDTKIPDALERAADVVVRGQPGDPKLHEKIGAAIEDAMRLRGL